MRYFAAVAETLSFTAAARRLRVSQPPVTRQIALLEEEFGLQLLRRPSGTSSSPMPGACSMTGSAACSRPRTPPSRRHGTPPRARPEPCGSATAARACTSCPMSCGHFASPFPASSLPSVRSNLGYQLTAIRDGQIDIGLVVQPVDDALIETQPFAVERLMVALPASHPLRGRSALSLSDLGQEQFVMVPWRKGHGFGRLIMRVCGRAGFVPTIEQEAEPMDSVLGLVSAGVGIALVPALYTRLPVPRIVYKPLRERFAVADIALAWRTDDASPVRRAFVDIAGRTAAPMRSSGKGASSAPNGPRRLRA